MATSVGARHQSGGGGYTPSIVPAHARGPRVAVAEAPSLEGAAATGGAAALTAAWIASRGTLGQRLGWSGGLFVASFLGTLEGHGLFAAVARGVLGASAAVGTLEATGIGVRA